MNREGGLAEILESIQSDSVKERESGLADLRYALDHRKADNLQSIKDKLVHRIFEILFQACSRERGNLARATKPTVKATSESRLISCASALRSATAALVHKIRLKTLRAYLGHVIQTLPCAEEGLCKPLSDDYIKSLLILLEHQPHTEHLLQEDWCNIVDFCLEGIETLNDNVAESASAGDSLFASRTTDILSQRHSDRVANSQRSNDKSSRTRNNLYGMLHCLRHLTATPSAPVSCRINQLWDGVVGFLESCSGTTSAHVAALSTVNVVLSRTTLGDASFMTLAVSRILPLIGNLWRSRDSLLRDQLLLALITMLPHLERLQYTPISDQINGQVDSLVVEMRNDYLQNEQRDRKRLVMDDLCHSSLKILPEEHKIMARKTFTLRHGVLSAEHAWTILSILAFLTAWTDQRAISLRRNSDHAGDSQGARKRQKPMPLRVKELFDSLKPSLSAERVQLLQIALFSSSTRAFAEHEVQEYAQAVVELLKDHDKSVSGWAYLILAELSTQYSSRAASLLPVWKQVAQTAWTHVNSASHCRASSHCLTQLLEHECVTIEDMSTFVDNMLSSTNLHAPGIVCDSSIALWCVVAAKLSHGQAISGACHQGLLDWLLTKWQPSNFENRTYSQQFSASTSCLDLKYAFALVLGHPYPQFRVSTFFVLGDLGRAWKMTKDQQPLCDYVFLLQSDHSHHRNVSFTEESSPDPTTVVNRLTAKDATRIQSYFVAEAQRVHDSLSSGSSVQPFHITPDMSKVLGSFCIVSAWITACLRSQDKILLLNLSKNRRDIAEYIGAYLSRSQTPRSAVDDFLMMMTHNLPHISSSVDQVSKVAASVELGTLKHEISQAIRVRRSKVDALHEEDSGQFDDVESLNDSQANRGRRKELQTLERDNLGNLTSRASASSCVEIYLVLCRDLGEKSVDDDKAIVPIDFVQHLTALPAPNFLLSKPFLQEMVNSGFKFSDEQLISLLDYVKECYLSSYEYERCEVAIDLCLQLMKGSSNFWAGSAPSALVEDGADLYNWFVDNFAACSSRVQVTFSDLLSNLLEKYPDYGKDPLRPSVRTTLLGVLRDSEISVQYHIAQSIPKIFGKFILSQHEIIFDDVHEVLPRDESQVSGLALRLFILTKLGSTWKTLLRRCTYHIFETAGLVPSAIGHATRCIEQITIAYRLESSKNLLRLFQGQLLFTWLDKDHANQTLDSIPFSIFGFPDLLSFLKYVQSEVVSQVAIHDSDVHRSRLAEIYSCTFTDLILSSFGQTMAYVLAKDAAAKAPDQSRRLEIRIRDLLGHSRYASLIQRELAVIIAFSIDHLHGEDNMVKYLTKREGFEAAADRLSSIKALGWTIAELPPTQQPSFKSRYFPDIISRLARRVHKAPEDIWTPQNVVIVVRVLLGSVSDVLGPLHVRRVIARLAIVVSLASTATAQDYPLQQLVHGIRPFVTDQQCASDAASLMQYLLTEGQQSLRRSPQFSLGTTLALQLALKSFVKRPHDPSIQQSEQAAATQRVVSFQKWLDEFDLNLLPDISADYPESSVRLCRQIMSLARTASHKANAVRDSAESMLLKFLLSDIRMHRSSLSIPYRKLCFEFFVKDFTAPETESADIFGSDSSAERYMSHLWQSCKQFNVSDAYLQWAAKALGRGFGHRGQISSSLVSESSLKHNVSLSKSRESHSSSEVAILHCVADCLEFPDPFQVEAAEKSLRRLYAALEGTENESILSDVLGRSFMASFSAADSLLDDSESISSLQDLDIENVFANSAGDTCDFWLQKVTVMICRSTSENRTLLALLPAVSTISTLASHVLPFVLHLALLESVKNVNSATKDHICNGIRRLFESMSAQTLEHCRSIINCILYLRTQAFPGEPTRQDRHKWLEDISTEMCANVAVRCRMFKAATLLLESSSARLAGPLAEAADEENSVNDMLLFIFQQIDEPDSYYGIQQAANLNAITSRLDFEGKVVESLTMHGAEMDSLVRCGKDTSPAFSKLLLSLSRMNLNSLSQQLAVDLDPTGQSDNMLGSSITKSALKLQKWDVALQSSSPSTSSTLYKTLQNMSGWQAENEAQLIVSVGLLEAVKLTSSHHSALTEPLRQSFAAISALTEINDLVNCQSLKQRDIMHGQLRLRESWMAQSSLEDVSLLLSSRESFFSVTAKSSSMKVVSPEMQRLNWSSIVKANLDSARIYRLVGNPQNSLSNIVYLSNIQESYQKVGLSASSEIQLETARVLWDRGERAPSIKMLQELISSPDGASDSTGLGRAGLLALLAHCVSEARLENPDDIMRKYLKEALKELGSATNGVEAGKVFHEFATYCHNQLTSPDFVAEFDRSEKFRRAKRKELQDLDNLGKSKLSDQEKHKLRSDKNKVKKWLSIDDQDFKRLRETRNQFLRQSLENYLMSLSASDEQDSDILRFFALWLEHSTEDTAIDVVQNRIGQVPSRKFIQLMNQLASRLQDSGDTFQATMAELVERICSEHPYHGMNHIFAGSHTEGGNDTTANSRHAAAVKIAQKLQAGSKTWQAWSAISKSNELFIKAASFKSDEMKQGIKLRLRNFNATKALEREVPELKVPPITMHIPIRDDLDYSETAVVASFHPFMIIAGGISTPKIITAVSSAGIKYVQLYKAGSDDLRQDAIMEQVFEQVSGLLKTTKATRQRKLGIRTYKVVPLNAKAGAIEFVNNTTSFNDYLNEAHMRYHPTDLRWNAARRKIDGAKELKLGARVQVYKEVATRFSPVLRHFFLENFEDPDEWFATRLAYTRSTAAISILGHILGLGDRHCQNILLDKTSGEVVHIDLGVAFEAGRILNIPEVVPFRLTRDVVDGFGITKTEGVFRRCCEFTLEALRKNKDAIMTILNVLRYDPLYSWSVSPLRAKKLQEEQERDVAAAQDTAVSFAPGMSMANRTRASTRASVGDEEVRSEQAAGEQRKKKNDDEDGGEADRALSVVERKLAAGLSVEATVNELIQQASDEKNLAVLFCGWAAFA